MTPRTIRWSKRLLVPLAALPLLQATGCDPGALAIQLGSNVTTSLIQNVLSAASGSFVQFLVATFPGANILRSVLGAGS